MKRERKNKGGRPTLPEGEVTLPISVSLPTKHLEVLEAYSRARRWSRAKAAGYLIEMGLINEKMLSDPSTKEAA
jgi:hypothetical protein